MNDKLTLKIHGNVKFKAFDLDRENIVKNDLLELKNILALENTPGANIDELSVITDAGVKYGFNRAGKVLIAACVKDSEDNSVVLSPLMVNLSQIRLADKWFEADGEDKWIHFEKDYNRKPGEPAEPGIYLYLEGNDDYNISII